MERMMRRMRMRRSLNGMGRNMKRMVRRAKRMF